METVDYKQWIGKKVKKISGRPFKSRSRENTVRDVSVHPILSQTVGRLVYCFYFLEDDSYVACDSCELVLT